MSLNDLPPQSEADVVRRTMEILADRLPSAWTMAPTIDASGSRGADGLYALTAPDGRQTRLVVEAKRILEGRDIPSVVNQLRNYVGAMPDAQGLLVARYLSPPVRARLIESGVSFVDATGNVRVEVKMPGLYIADRGADADPWRGPGRPRGTLKGAPAAKAVRAIADFPGSWTVRELVNLAGISTGAGYRVVDFLQREGLADKGADGRVSVPRWDKVLRRWSEDYGFVRNSTVTRWIAPRGLDGLLKRVADAPFDGYAVTGTLAAVEWAAYAPARSAMIYTTNAVEAAAAWSLRPTEAGANVMLAEPEIDVPFIRTLTTKKEIKIVAPTQAVVDLMTGPGRSPQEAEELLQWMVANEQSWRA